MVDSAHRTRTAFTSTQYEHPYPDAIENHYWHQARHRILDRTLEGLLEHQPASAILDIGCGRGITVAHLRERGFEAFGCDLGTPKPIHDGVASFLHLGADVFSLELAARDRIKIILLLDVLEHLHDPTSFLERCYERFSQSEYIVATVPARMQIWSNFDEYYGHFTRYDHRSFRGLVPPALFELTHCRYFFHGLYPFARMMSLMGLERSIDVAAPDERTRWIHRAVGRYFDWEAKWSPAVLPGTSLLAVLRAHPRHGH
ncbi:class I SAM-dependent methyltransferase [Pendulispora albinea]|uniref:Class I SAM-dependent methyltransferase n=1 Tax=Pendulispora albinea TaxID=2741071 RepID=A0ABZ2LKI0_9BACT